MPVLISKAVSAVLSVHNPTDAHSTGLCCSLRFTHEAVETVGPETHWEDTRAERYNFPSTDDGLCTYHRLQTHRNSVHLHYLLVKTTYQPPSRSKADVVFSLVF